MLHRLGADFVIESSKKYLKCACEHCGATIEYPDYAAGTLSLCQQCGKTTATPKASTSAPAPKPVAQQAPQTVPQPSRQTAQAPEPRKRSRSMRPVLVAIPLLICAGVWFATRKSVERPTVVSEKETPVVEKAVVKSTAPQMAMGTNEAPVRSVEDLKTSVVRIQKPRGGRGSRLIYGVGSLTNTSTAQRLGVKVEVEFLNERGDSIDKSADYRAALMPGEIWNFRALAHDPLVSTGFVARITEEN